MAKVRQTGTDAELALRREMHRIGLRYRVGYEVLKKPRRVASNGGVSHSYSSPAPTTS